MTTGNALKSADGDELHKNSQGERAFYKDVTYFLPLPSDHFSPYFLPCKTSQESRFGDFLKHFCNSIDISLSQHVLLINCSFLGREIQVFFFHKKILITLKTLSTVFTWFSISSLNFQYNFASWILPQEHKLYIYVYFSSWLWRCLLLLSGSGPARIDQQGSPSILFG